MAYVPSNVQIFTAAYSGCLAGMGVSDRVVKDTNAATYANLATVAGAFSKAVDTAWGVRATTLLDIESMQSICEAYWQNRSPLASADNINPVTHAAAALAIIAIITAGESYFSEEGIAPPSAGAGISAYLNIDSINSHAGISSFEGIRLENANVNVGFQYSAVTGAIVPDADGLYLINYTLRVAANAGAQSTWGIIEVDGESSGTTDRSTSSIEDSGAAAAEVLTISQSVILQLYTNLQYYLGNVSGVNGSVSGVGGPSATLTAIRIA